MGRPVRVLCTGDWHVGRAPSRVGDERLARRCTCAAMVDALVEEAVSLGVDAVAISGDVIDRENRFFEAYGPVERGLRRLLQADIDVLLVAGNHDYDVLPRLATELRDDRFHFLGPGGTWGHATVVRDGTPVLRAIGWSFPEEAVLDSPMRTYPRGGRGSGNGNGNAKGNGSGSLDGLPTLGLLHADLDAPASRYAPVATSELHAERLAMWLLGHIHAPRLARQDGYPTILYPGSPQALDPGETGTHGPWLATFDAGRVLCRQVPLSRVRYETIPIDLTGVDTEEAFATHVPRAIRAALEPLSDRWGPLVYCCCRLALTGRTRLHRRLHALAAKVQDELELTIADATARIDKILVETRAAIDLPALAERRDVVGELARLIRSLSDERTMSDEVRMLVARSAEQAEAVCAQKRFQHVSADEHPAPDVAAARASLLRQAMLLLDALVAQKQDDEERVTEVVA